MDAKQSGDRRLSCVAQITLRHRQQVSAAEGVYTCRSCT